MVQKIWLQAIAYVHLARDCNQHNPLVLDGLVVSLEIFRMRGWYLLGDRVGASEKENGRVPNIEHAYIS